MHDPQNSTEEERVQHREEYKALTQSKYFQTNGIGSRLNRLFLLKNWIAKAYEAVGKYNNAFSINQAQLCEMKLLSPREISKVETLE
jgi:hypothetical protein